MAPYKRNFLGVRLLELGLGMRQADPQTNGICERFHKTILEEFYIIAFRKKIYLNIDELQKDLDIWLERYNTSRPHQGKHCQGWTPMETFIENLSWAKDKLLDMKFDLAA